MRPAGSTITSASTIQTQAASEKISTQQRPAQHQLNDSRKQPAVAESAWEGGSSLHLAGAISISCMLSIVSRTCPSKDRDEPDE